MFEDLKNIFDFFIRNKTKFSRKNFVETDLKLIERNKRENLYTKDLLSGFFNKTPRTSIRALDIGCKNWFYVKGEYEFFKTFAENVYLDGVEIDAYRLYSNLYSRYEVAKYYISNLKNVNYIVGNLLDLEGEYDYITWFLPFVTIKPLQYWGLPKKYFCPEKMLLKAYSLLKVGGEMLIINQGEEEAGVQKKLLEELGFLHKELGEVKSEFFEYKNKRFGFLVKKIR